MIHHVLPCFCAYAEGGLMSKDTLPTQSTTLEALLRGEGLDKRNNSKNDEESLLEIQVGSVRKVGNSLCMHVFDTILLKKYIINV